MPLPCPNDHGPFPHWADRCPECGAFLVGREPIVPLATAPNELVAAIWLDALARAGVRAYATAVGPGFGSLGTNAVIEHEIRVAAPDLERARSAIAAAPVRARRAPVRTNPRRKPGSGRPPTGEDTGV